MRSFEEKANRNARESKANSWARPTNGQGGRFPPTAKVRHVRPRRQPATFFALTVTCREVAALQRPDVEIFGDGQFRLLPIAGRVTAHDGKPVAGASV